MGVLPSSAYSGWDNFTYEGLAQQQMDVLIRRGVRRLEVYGEPNNTTSEIGFQRVLSACGSRPIRRFSPDYEGSFATQRGLDGALRTCERAQVDHAIYTGGGFWNLGSQYAHKDVWWASYITDSGLHADPQNMSEIYPYLDPTDFGWPFERIKIWQHRNSHREPPGNSGVNVDTNLAVWED